MTEQTVDSETSFLRGLGRFRLREGLESSIQRRRSAFCPVEAVLAAPALLDEGME